MENYFYLAVRIAAAAYILYKVWRLLFTGCLFGLWDRIPVKERKSTAAVALAKGKPDAAVLGRTNIVLLDDPRRVVPEPAASSDLEPTGYIGIDKSVASEDVESPEPPPIPTDDELYGDEPPPDGEGVSSGVSYEELSDAADVLVTDTRDEARRTKAAKTLYDIQGTEILDFIVREVCGADAIDSLLKECLDGDGFPLKRKNPVAEFDIGKYV
jgi:hypothetical protein